MGKVGRPKELEDEVRLHIRCSREVLEKIEDYRFSERQPSRSEAIRNLLLEGIARWQERKKATPVNV